MLQEFIPYVEPRRRRRNLVLVTDPEIDLEDDFRRIAAQVRETAPDVVPFVLPRARLSHWQRLKLATRPTLAFSPGSFTRPRFYRGARRHGCRMLKRQEYAALDRAGVAVPQWTLLTSDTEPDLSGFGPYVVVKPDLGWRGAEVKVKRRARVRWKHPAMHQGTPSDWIVQDFVYTGRWPRFLPGHDPVRPRDSRLAGRGEPRQAAASGPIRLRIDRGPQHRLLSQGLHLHP